jgi:Clostripain family
MNPAFRLSSLAALVLLSGVPVTQAQNPSPTPAANWTVMIYMDGNNELEPFAFKNFAQMASIQDSPDVNIVVELARQATAVVYPGWKGCLRFKIVKGITPELDNSVEKQSDSNLEESKIPDPNMGEAATLGNFVTWARSNYPAKHYMLVMWDHGDGWRFFDTVKIKAPKNILKVVQQTRKQDLQKAADQTLQFTDVGTRPLLSVLEKTPGIPADQALRATTFRALTGDEAHGGTILYNRDIADVLRQVLKDDKLDVLGFDACLMSMIETAYAMRGVANVMVGSEELEPGNGWHYDKWLSALIQNPLMSPNELGKSVVQSYKAAYDSTGDSVTLSAVKLDTMSKLAQSIDRFSDILIRSTRSKDELTLIREVRNWCFSYAPKYGIQSVDLGQFSEVIGSTSRNPTLRQAAQQVRQDLNASVLDNYMSPDRGSSSGLAIYFPASGALFSTDESGSESYNKKNTKHPVEFVQDHKWSDFVGEYCLKVP